MTHKQLTELLNPFLVDFRMGIFEGGEYDLTQSHDGKSFILRLDVTTIVRVPLKVTRLNANLIQKTVRAMGKELVHTWNHQYSREP